MDNSNSFGTSLDYLMSVPAFTRRAHPILVPQYNLFADYCALDQWRIYVRDLRAARRERALLLFSSRGKFKPSLWAIITIGLWPKRYRPTIVLNGDMWEPDEGILFFIERIIIRLADHAIARYAVYSSEELEIFPQVWGVDAAKMRFTPYFYTITKAEIPDPLPPEAGHIFSGGIRFRDYHPLIEAARRMPEHRFVIATDRLDSYPDLPANVTAHLVQPDEFTQLMLSASVVVIPMQQGLHRSAGHQTYLNAMLCRKLTIVNDVNGVRDHVRDHETGLIVDGSPESYVTAIRWALDPANKKAVETICAQAAQDVAINFSPERHAEHMLAIMDEVTPSASDTTGGG